MNPDKEFLKDVLEGLSRPQKEISCKYFYDKRGSELFDQICGLDEYYLTRAELAIMRRHAGQMAACVGPGAGLIEYGMGSGHKTAFLLRELDRPAVFVPVDISAKHLAEAVERLREKFPDLVIRPVCADFTGNFAFSLNGLKPARMVAFFPGSTIGNFSPERSRRFLEGIVHRCGPGGGLVIGVDLKKDPGVLEAAYNDARGLTRLFNLNLLDRINRELGANFETDAFEHRAVYDSVAGCVEMRLISRRDQVVRIGEHRVSFKPDEVLVTERSYKYAVDEFARLAHAAGMRQEQVWIDPDRLFSVQYFGF